MATPNEATDSLFSESVLPESGKETRSEIAPPPEKQYRLYNVSGQTLYVVNVDGTICLPPREHYDLPFLKISHHIKLMTRRGFITLFEKEEEKT